MEVSSAPAATSEAAHWRQKCESFEFSAPHFGQEIVMASPEACGKVVGRGKSPEQPPASRHPRGARSIEPGSKPVNEGAPSAAFSRVSTSRLEPDVASHNTLRSGGVCDEVTGGLDASCGSRRISPRHPSLTETSPARSQFARYSGRLVHFLRRQVGSRGRFSRPLCCVRRRPVASFAVFAAIARQEWACERTAASKLVKR